MKKTLRKSLTTVIVTFCMLFLLSIPVQASAFKVVPEKKSRYHLAVPQTSQFNGMSVIVLSYH